MNKNINLIEILKDVPKETKLWSPICGECELVIVDALSEYTIKVSNGKDGFLSFLSDGRYVDCIGGECLLFPSKENRDWSTFKAPRKHKHFEPFEKVLVKSYDAENAKDIWIPSLYGCYVSESKKHCSVAGVWYKDDEILAYKGNEDKLGKPVK